MTPLPRPRRPGLPIAATLGAVIMWGIVAHDSGVGWVQATGTLVGGFLAVGLLAPAVAVSRARCRVVSAPLDAVAGQRVVVEIETSGALELRAGAGGAPSLSGPDRRCRLEVVAPGRGVATSLAVTVASAAPFGFLWWTRPMVLVLTRPMAVAPRTGPADPTLVQGAQSGGVAPGAARADELRGVRPYIAGDPRRLVHWPATAHTGALMVRETERLRRQPASVWAVLPDDPAAAERLAERAMGTVGALLAAGGPVELVTAQPEGITRVAVTTPAAAGRQLARALPEVAW